MNDEVSTAITAPGGIVFRDETHGVETEEESVETEEGSVEAEEGIRFLLCITTFWQQMDRRNATPQGTTRSKREDSDEKLKGS